MNQFLLGVVFAWSVIDGDTMNMNMHIWPNLQVEGVRVRLLDVDTPELRASSDCERALALKAKEYSQQRLQEAKSIEVRTPLTNNKDSFGRILGWVYLDGIQLNQQLIAAGLGRQWGLKGAWC